MRPTGRVVAIVLTSVSVVLVDACHKAPPPPPPAPAVDTAAINKAARDAEAARQKHIADSLAAVKAEQDRQKAIADSAAVARERQRQQMIRDSIANAAAEAARETAAMTTTLQTVVHFDYDKSELKDDAKAALDAKLPILRANPAVTIRIAGNTDERGSDEYNLALGQRRAEASKQYLVDRGIPATRIETISYGKERKLCQDKNEGCYSQNRRDEFEITAGGNMLKKP